MSTLQPVLFQKLQEEQKKEEQKTKELVASVQNAVNRALFMQDLCNAAINKMKQPLIHRIHRI